MSAAAMPQATVEQVLGSSLPPYLLQCDVRVAGVLTEHAQCGFAIGRDPVYLLTLRFVGPSVAASTPFYLARINIGSDVATQMQVEAMLPLLREGCYVSVGADALGLHTEHGRTVLRLLNARALVALGHHHAAN